MKKILFASLLFLCGITKLIAQTPDSLSIKIGQMILIGMPKAEVDPIVLEEVRQGKAGSIIYFEKNIPKTNSFAEFKKMSWTYQQAAPIPLFISIDQEGGKVNRLKEKYGFPRSITARAMGKDKMLDSVRFYAGSIAANLAGLGINVNFAPCVDLAVNPDNTVIVKPERAFSSNEDSVAMMAIEYIKQHRKVGVITTLKHFPGHGSSKEDTHFGVADVTNTWSERELKPYKMIIDSGYVDAVMTSHIVNKNLDKNGLPGTLSKDILDGILRKKLGFNGVVISDDMQMHAIAKNYGLEETIKLAINAGVDIMCFSNNIAGSEERTVTKVHEIIRKFVESGELSKARIDESFHRIMKLKYRLNHNPDEIYRRELLAAQQQAIANQNLAVENEEKAKAIEEKYKEEMINFKKSKKRK
ncbi:MAG: glycoside hydrolase family 3 protein [Bacteroidia bacterium]|nr:glycoside hydrolase family 3 protein [Bacteroidia bacterium]